jgi:hypothetical protein
MGMPGLPGVSAYQTVHGWSDRGLERKFNMKAYLERIAQDPSFLRFCTSTIKAPSSFFTKPKTNSGQRPASKG